MPLNDITVVLVRPQQPGNVGLAARALSTHGLTKLALVQPQGFDPDRARWMAPNSHHIIDEARFCSSIAEAVSGSSRVIATSARPRRWGRPVWNLAEVAEMTLQDPTGTALIFGPEDSGLSTEDLALCHGILTLPTTQTRSVNLGQAVGIVCGGLLSYQETRTPAAATLDPSQIPSPSWLQDAVVDDAVDVLEAAGYLTGRNTQQVHGTLYRLLARTQTTEREAANLRGMIAQLQWWFRERSQ